MNTITFDKLLLKTAFCCMASDGHIDPREIELIKSLCEKSFYISSTNFEEEINELVNQINSNGKVFIKEFLDQLSFSILSDKEELTLIDFAIKTIKADEIVEYSEIKFFKTIRHRLKISDETILATFPDIEEYLEQDIITDSFIDKITRQFIDTIELPQFEIISINDINKNDD